MKTYLTMVKEAYITHETSVLLKEKGFNEPCTGLSRILCKDGEHPVLEITQQKAAAWLREQNNLYIEIRVDFSDGVYPMYDAFIINLKSCDRYSVLGYDRYSYYDAVETSLKYCLTKLL